MGVRGSGASSAVTAGDAVTDTVDGEVAHEGGYGDGDANEEDERDAFGGGLHTGSDRWGVTCVQNNWGGGVRLRRRWRLG